MLFKKSFFFVLVLLLAITAPVFAHDVPSGSSRWAFGSNTILGFIDLKQDLLSQIKEIKEGHYDLQATTDEQLRQMAAGVLQPYIDQKLSLAVNNKTYPIKVTKVLRYGSVYTICLSVNGVRFTQPVNQVRIVYSLLMQETDNQHINIALGYVTDATGNELENIFASSPAVLQATFDAGNTAWEISVKGAASAPAAEAKAESSVAQGGVEGSQHPAAKESIAGHPQASAVAQKAAPPKATISDPGPAVSSRASRPAPPSEGKASWTQFLWPTLRQFVPLGIKHILTGYDHIAFLLAIIVLELSVVEILKIISAFTLAHSITLLLAALNLISLNARFVECAIAFSICYVALENIFRKKANYRWLITFGFGLIHGFGFASALRELIVGKANLLLSVVSFNLGVEMGQLTLFFVMLPILYLLKKQIGLRTVTLGASVAVFVMGFTWLVERVFSVRLLWF